jgi:hypothetical protein
MLTEPDSVIITAHNLATFMFLLATSETVRVNCDPVTDPALPNYDSAITGHIREL